MPLSNKVPEFIHRTLSIRKNSQTKKFRRSAPLLIVGIVLMAAVGFSVSVESRKGGWLWKTQPGVSPSKSEPAKDSTGTSAHAVNPKHSVADPMLAPFAPTVTASKVDSLLVDVDTDGKADPGDKLKYTVTIGATGEDATGVTFTDTVDPNTTFEAGSLRTTPLARNDSYTATGNVRISIAAPGVLTNDADPDGVGPAITATAGTFASAQGGNVSMNADGSFTYNPPAGFEGNDSFTYTLNDNEGNTDTGTASITVSGMIWFVNNTASCPCDGRLTNPFNTLASFQAVNDGGNSGLHPAANDNIFVYESVTDYVGPVTLLNGQKFIGQDATTTLASIAGITLAPNSDPLPVLNSGNGTIVNITSASAGINVGQNNTLRGFTGGNAAPDISGSGFVTLNVSEVTLNGNGGALSLTNGNLTGSFGSISSTNSATTGISLTTVAGSLTTGSTTVTNPTGIGISVNTSSATLNFANTSATSSGGAGVSLTTNTGTITFGSLTITPDAGQRGLLATDNTNTITVTSGAITTTTGTAVEITRSSSTTPLAVTLTSVSSSGAPNGIMLKNTSGSFTVVGDGANTTLGGNNTGGTISSATGANGATAGNGVYLENAGNVTLRRLRVNGTNQNFGIRGVNLSNFTLEFSTVTGNNGDSAADDEGAVGFGNLTGTAAITSCVIEGGFEDNLSLVNTSGTLNRLTMSSNTFGLNNTVSGNSNIRISSNNAGTTLNFTLKSSLIKGARADWISAIANSGSTMDALIGGPLVADGNNFDNTGANANAGAAAGGNRLVTTSVGTQTVDIRNNTLKGSKGEAMLVRSTSVGTTRGNLNARVRNNTIGVAATANSGSSEGSGIFLTGDGGGNVTAAITSNTVRQYNNHGIRVDFGDEILDGASYNVTVTGNTVGNPGNLLTDFNGFHLNNGTVGATDNFTTCLDLNGNTLTGSGSGVTPPNNQEFRLRQRQSTTVRLPGYAGANNNDAQVVLFIRGQNTVTAGNGASSNTVPTGGGFVGGAACTAPGFAGPITSDVTSLSTESTGSQLRTALDRGESTLYATRGENSDPQHVVSLTQSEASAMFQAAVARWAEAGLSATNMARLQSLSVEVADLPAGQLSTATSSKITLDATAAGYGWFFDATPSDDNEFEVPVLDKERQTTDTSVANSRIDLLTVLLRQLGTGLSFGKSGLQGPAAWLMEGTLDTGERRAPALKAPEVGKLKSAPGATVAKQARATTRAAKGEESYQQVAANGPRNAKVVRNHALRAPMSVADVVLSIGVLPAGKTITVTFNATVKDPFPGPGAQVCNQGTVSGSNFSNVLTDDPSVVGATDPTCTDIDLKADLEVTKSDSPDPVIAGNNLTYTINFTNHGPNPSGATVTDATPAGTTFVSASVTSGTGWGITNPSVGGTGNVVFTKGTVAKDETAVFQIVVKVNSSVAGGSTINNSATAATTGGPTDPVPGNNTGNASTAVIAQADLSITKTDGATTEIPGTSISYTITVNNSGPSDANGVSVADTFPSDLTGVTFTSVAAGGATGNTAAGAGNIGDTVNMPTGSSITYTVNATIKSSATGSLSNTATVTAPGGVTDPSLGNNSATDTDTLVPTADLSITKTDGVTSKVPGTSVTYTIVVSNSGPSDAPGTAVADTFPGTLTGVTFTSVAAGGATGNTAAGAGNINDTVSLPSGGSVTYTVSATIQSSATGSLSNTATVTAGAGVTDPTAGNNSATDTDTLTPQADLSITKTDGSATEVPGTPVTYTITVTNNGPSDAPGASVADLFPGTISGVAFTSVAAGGATGNTAAGSGNISDLVNMPAGSSVTYTATGNIASSATGSLSNTATVTAPGGVTDPTPANNSATDTDTLTPQADLSITKTDGVTSKVPGTSVTYTIVVTNSGPSDAAGTTVGDSFPASLTGVAFTSVASGGATGNTAAGAGNINDIVSLPVGSSITYTVNATIDSSATGSLSNTATVTAGGGVTDPTPGNNSATDTDTLTPQADLSITKTDGATTEIPGTSVTYTITVSNAGPSDASGVSVSDTFPGTLTGVTFTSVAAGGATGNTAAGAGNISDTVTVPAGGSITYTVTATIQSSATGSLSNTATVTAPAGVDPNAGNNSATDTDTLEPTADLQITKTDGATTEVPGTSVTYTVTVTNNGPSDASGVSVADTFPGTLTGVTFTSVAAGGATGNTAAGSGSISDTLNMPAGSSVTYTVTATIQASATGSLSNTATVTAPGDVTDPNNANNSATDTDTLTPEADLTVTKTDGSATATPGSPVTYTITVTNSGPSNAPGTAVSDTFPGILTGVTFTSVAAGGATGNTAAGSGNIGDTLNLPSGGSVTYTVNATVSASATGSLSNTATVSAGAGVTDPTPGNNSATDTDTLTPSADVSVTKTDSPDPVVVGNNITYTITVNNGGPSDAQSLSLSDAVPANTTLVSVTTPSGWTRTDAVPVGGTGTLTFTRATQAAGASSIFTVVVNVTAGTTNGTIITNTANVSSATADPAAGNNSATATTTVQSNADLAISKQRSPSGTIDAGSNVTYTIDFTNNGPAPASNVTVTDTLPPGVTLVSQSNPAGWTCNTIPAGGTGTITCTKATMASGETAQLTVVVAVSCSVANGATINNTATIASGAGSPPDNNSGNNSSTASFTVNNPAVTVSASVTMSQLPQNSHDLINVGLAALASGGTANCPPGPLTVQVFGDEDDQTPTNNAVFSPDAKDIAVGTLRLRGERVDSGNGRVYLIVVRSGSSFATVTVVVPKSNSPANVNAVNAEAAAAKAFADSHNGSAPAGYFVIGDGPIIGNKQ